MPAGGRPSRASLVAGGLIVVGVLIWFVPYLTRARQGTVEVPTPSALFALTEFPVQPNQQACMGSVTIAPAGQVAEFELRPAKASPRGGPPVELLVTAAGYRGVVHVPGGYPGGSVTLPLSPAPTQNAIGTACFINHGTSTVLLDGTTEARSVAHSATEINGKAIAGDIALSFLEARNRSLLDRLGEILGHASGLTDHLVPVWLLWILTVLVALGVPIGTVAAFYRALREDEAHWSSAFTSKGPSACR